MTSPNDLFSQEPKDAKEPRVSIVSRVSSIKNPFHETEESGRRGWSIFDFLYSWSEFRVFMLREREFFQVNWKSGNKECFGGARTPTLDRVFRQESYIFGTFHPVEGNWGIGWEVLEHSRSVLIDPPRTATP